MCDSGCILKAKQVGFADRLDVQVVKEFFGLSQQKEGFLLRWESVGKVGEVQGQDSSVYIKKCWSITPFEFGIAY